MNRTLFGVTAVIALFYLYGAIVHIANMASLTGFPWMSAPLKWQILDIVYLIIDVAVVVLLFLRPKISVLLIVIAATSQIVLYTIGRAWIVVVPEPFQPAPEDLSYLNGLIGFHIISLVALALSAVFGKRSAAPPR